MTPMHSEHAAIFPTFMTKVQQQTFFKRLVTVRSGQLDSFSKLTIRLFLSRPQIRSRKARESLASWFQSWEENNALPLKRDTLSFPQILHVHHLTPENRLSLRHFSLLSFDPFVQTLGRSHLRSGEALTQPGFSHVNVHTM
jgi:hypothetical protein